MAFGIWYLVFGIWYLVSIAFEGPFVASPVFGIWYLAFGIWNLVFGIWHLEFGIWYLVFWHLVFGIWYVVFGIRYLASKIFEDPFVASPAFDIWYLAFGIKSTFYPFLFLPNNFYGSKEKVEILSTNSFCGPFRSFSCICYLEYVVF